MITGRRTCCWAGWLPLPAAVFVTVAKSTAGSFWTTEGYRTSRSAGAVLPDRRRGSCAREEVAPFSPQLLPVLDTLLMNHRTSKKCCSTFTVVRLNVNLQPRVKITLAWTSIWRQQLASASNGNWCGIVTFTQTKPFCNLKANALLFCISLEKNLPALQYFNGTNQNSMNLNKNIKERKPIIQQWLFALIWRNYCLSG